MHKKIIIVLLVLILFIPFKSKGYRSWSFRNLTIFGCMQWRVPDANLYGGEIMFDQFGKTCTHFKHYKGVALQYVTNGRLNEWSMRGFLNPSRLLFALNRAVTIYPFLFCQANYLRGQSNSISEKSQVQGFSLRPGIGLTTHYSTKPPKIRTLVLIGYDVHQQLNGQVGFSWIAEIKIGWAFQTPNKKIDESSPADPKP